MQNEAQQQALADAIATAENHASLGKTLQASGVRILNSIPMTKDGRSLDLENNDAEDLAQLIRDATATIDKGIALESHARQQLLRLRAMQAHKEEEYLSIEQFQ